METRRFPLASILATRDATVDKDGLLSNCYRESTPLGDQIVKRPGYTLAASLGVGCAQGGITYDGQAIWVVSDTLHVTGGAGVPVLSSFTAVTTPTLPSNGSAVGTARPGHLVSHSDGNLYSIGGFDNGGDTISVYRSTDNGTSWSTISTPWDNTPVNIEMSLMQCAVSFGGNLYVSGIVMTGIVRGVWRSTNNGVSWSLLTSDLIGSGSHKPESMIVHNSQLYLTLTRDNADTPEIWRSSDGITWTGVNSGITALGNRANMGFASHDNKLYLIGGSISNTTLFDTVYVSSDNGANWTLLATSTAFGNRAGMATWVIQDRIWFGGGFATQPFSTAKNDVWSSADGSAWLQAASSSAWSARWAPSNTIHNSKLYIGPGIASSAIVAGLFHATPTISTSIPLTPPPATSCLPFQLTLIPATATTPVAVFLKNNEVAYYYNGLSVTQITDPDYPSSTVFGVVYLDGTIYVMNSRGVIFGSDLASPTSWSALNFITANAEADAAVALVRQLNYVVAFKDFSTEFFYNAGNATGSPLAKVLNALLEIGCASAGSIAFSDNTIYFMANSRQKGRSIMKMEGYTPKYISNQYVDRILNADSLAEVYAFVVKTNGHFFYVLTLINTGVTLVLDEVTGEWHRWTHLTSAAPVTVVTAVAQSDGSILATVTAPHGQSDGNVVTIAGATPAAANGEFNLRYDPSVHSSSQFSYVPATAVSNPITGTITATFYTESYFPGVYYAKGGGEDLLLDIDSGSVYEFDPATYQDNDLPINLLIRTALLDADRMATKRFSRFELVGDRITTDVLVRFSDDDYQSWSLYRTIPLAQKRAKLSNLGSARRRAYALRHTQNTPLRLLAAEMDFDLGAF